MKHKGMTKHQFAVWLHGLHTDATRKANTPDELLCGYWAECEDIQDGFCLCEVRARHSRTGNPYSFDFPEAWFTQRMIEESC